MIQIDEHFIVDLQLGGVRDVLRSVEDLISFKIVSGSRGELPSLEISFTSSNLDAFKSISEMNTLRLTYGRDLSSARVNEWEFKYPRVSKAGSDAYKYDLVCMMKVKDYLNNSKVKCIKGSSEHAIRTSLEGTGLELQSKVSCDDMMTWIKDSTTYKFIQDTYLRYWSGDRETCAAVAVTLDKKLRYFDLRKHISEKLGSPDYITSIADNGKLDCPDMFSIKNGDGVLNDWLGNGRNFIQYDSDTGMVEDIRPDISKSLFETQASMDQLLNRDVSKAPRAAPPQMFCGDNVHMNWNRAYAQNLTRLALVSSIGLSLQYNGKVVDLYPLDLVTVTSKEIKEEGDQSNGYAYTYTGVYLLDVWALHYQNGLLATRLDLTRDANSDVKLGG